MYAVSSGEQFPVFWRK